ncbi:hypothetical protein EAH79_12300 [Sphingomonas koreensis]|nr:hypothetical protein EAH79_12300 [Sphingomonas koreensis]
MRNETTEIEFRRRLNRARDKSHYIKVLATSPNDALTRLHNKVDRALAAVGVPPEGRTYLAHMTLARLPRAAGVEPEIARFLADHAALASPPFALSHLTLFESQLTREGARYDVVGRWPLC